MLSLIRSQLALLEENAEQKRVISELREEVARLKGLKGRPPIKPSGMEKGTTPTGGKRERHRGRGKATPRVSVEDEILKADVPVGSRFKGYEEFVVQDLVLRVRAVRYRRERWVTPDGRTVIAPLPSGVTGHFGRSCAASCWRNTTRVRSRCGAWSRSYRRSASISRSGSSCAC